MTQEELRRRVGELLRLEERSDTDWRAVQSECERLDRDIQGMPTDEVPDLLWHFLQDADVRQKDERYAEYQCLPLWSYVETGEMVEHAPSVALPWWGCLLVLVAAALLLTWVLW